MSNPHATRPYMPGYGILGPNEGRGLLPWSWAEERLTTSHDYWVATVWPDGRPHVMPVWGIWNDESVWFSSSLQSRKARNLRADPRCVVTTDNPTEPVVVEGVAEVVRDLAAIQEMVSRVNEKYASDITLEFMDPDVNATFRVRQRWVFSLNLTDGASPSPRLGVASPLAHQPSANSFITQSGSPCSDGAPHHRGAAGDCLQSPAG